MGRSWARARRDTLATRRLALSLLLVAPAVPGTAPARAEGGAAGERPLAPELTLAVGGDVMFGRVTARGYRAHGDADPYGGWGATVARADVAFVNLGTGICPEGRAEARPPLLWAPPDRIDALARAGVDVVSVAKSHALDCGLDGLDATLVALARRGVRAAGVAPAGAVHVTEEVVFLGATLQPAPYHATGSRPLYAPAGHGLVTRVRTLRAAETDRLLVVSLRWGCERCPGPAAEQRAPGRALLAAGANAAVGHGSHTSQPLERAGDGVILCGLGNLASNDTTPLGRPGAPWVLRFQRTPRGYVFVGIQGQRRGGLRARRVVPSPSATRRDAISRRRLLGRS